MPKRYEITPNQVEEIKAAQKRNKYKNVEARLRVLLLHAAGEKRKEIAKRTDFARDYVSKLVSKFSNEGLGSIVDNHYKGNRRDLSFEEEQALLETFKKQAEQGQLVETNAIKKAYEEATGRSLEKSHGQIYRVLKRHGWRKVMPRSKHPNKASDEAIEASKKLTLAYRS